MSQANAVIGVYKVHTQAEQAVRQLQKSGFNMRHLSIAGKEHHTDEYVIAYYNTGDRMKYWGKRGAFWGAIWGWLMGAAFFAVPGIGPVLVAGPLITWIVGALDGAAVMGGLSAVGAGLYSFGIPKNMVLKLETALSADKFLVVAHGSSTEVSNAREILKAAGAVDVLTHLDSANETSVA